LTGMFMRAVRIDCSQARGNGKKLAQWMLHCGRIVQ
jgi:hypothetical protein